MTVLLILSVGSLVGTNILDAVEAFRPGLRVVGVNSSADAPNNFRCDKVFLGPTADEVDAYGRRVQEVLELERPDVVMAGRDDDIALMAAWREQYPQFTHCLTAGSQSMSLPMTDKLAGYEWAVEHGLPFTPTVAADAHGAQAQCVKWKAELGCAWIAKPRGGNGSRGIRLLLDDAALTATLGDAEMVIQPYLADAEPYRSLQQQVVKGLPLFWTPTLTHYVVNTVIGPDRRILGRFDMEAKLVAGRCERALRFDNPEFREIGDRYAQALANNGWRGIANVQLVYHSKLGFQAIEFCGRAAGGLMPRLLLGFDEMALLLSAWTGRFYERSPAIPVTAVALRVTRDIGQDASYCAVLHQRGVWTSMHAGADFPNV